MAGAYLEGQNETLVKSVLKHFPGQGDAEVDTHLGAAVVELSKEELFETHLQPFKQLHAKAQGIMMAHSSYPAVDNLAASLSHTWITDILREEMGYRGLVYSDDFLMHAIPQDPASWREAVVESVAAGTDVILICRHIEKAQEAAEAMIAKMASSQAFTQIVESKRQSV
jgi:beta-N-acetylhexosaminidase